MKGEAIEHVADLVAMTGACVDDQVFFALGNEFDLAPDATCKRGVGGAGESRMAENCWKKGIAAGTPHVEEGNAAVQCILRCNGFMTQVKGDAGAMLGDHTGD